MTAASLSRMGNWKNLKRSPKNYLVDPTEWPFGEFKRNPPPEAYLIRGICQRLHEEYEEESEDGKEWPLKLIAEDLRISIHALFDLWNGNSWGTLPTIARIEIALRKRLWGIEHIRETRR